MKKKLSIFDVFFGKDIFDSMNFSFENSEFPEEGNSDFNKTEEIIETETHTIKKENWISIDGTQKFQRTSSQSKQKALKEPSKADLQLLLDKAVENQEFEKAIELRDKLKELK